ncbi:MAG: hypothetical protein ACI4HO_11450 [Ruminococcus sp.]
MIIYILLLLYFVLGYWSTGKTIYANKVIFYRPGQLFLQKFGMGAILGWILIPWAIIKTILGK